MFFSVRAFPARSTLFPYTTLFRSGTTSAVFTVSLSLSNLQTVTVGFATSNGTAIAGSDYVATNGLLRSEEHTTELPSHSDLVCRLLLEKNKTLFVNLSSPTNSLIS